MSQKLREENLTKGGRERCKITEYSRNKKALGMSIEFSNKEGIGCFSGVMRVEAIF